MESRCDEQLLAEVLAGDRQALAALVERHQQQLTNYLDRLAGGDWSLAQDLAQETFLRVLQSHSSRGNRPFKPWLYAIATNLARDHFKSAAVRRAVPFDMPQMEQFADERAGPERLALVGEQRATVAAAFRTLGAEYRAVLLLRFSSEMSLQEIADILDIPLGTVKSRLSVGLSRLRKALADAEAIGQGAFSC